MWIGIYRKISWTFSERISESFKLSVMALYQELTNWKIFYSKKGDGIWLSVQEALFVLWNIGNCSGKIGEVQVKVSCNPYSRGYHGNVPQIWNFCFLCTTRKSFQFIQNFWLKKKNGLFLLEYFLDVPEEKYEQLWTLTCPSHRQKIRKIWNFRNQDQKKFPITM